MIETPRCFERQCKHYTGVKQDNAIESTERPCCAAFTDGIPDEIAYGDNLHLTVLPGQGNDIVFEK